MLYALCFSVKAQNLFTVNNSQSKIELTDNNYNLDALILFNGIDGSSSVKYMGNENIEWRYTIDGSEYNSTQKEIIPEHGILYTIFVENKPKYHIYTIDYNEYKYNERREAATFSLRAFSAKMASSLQQGLLYLFLMASALTGVQQFIAQTEREYNINADVLGENYVFDTVAPEIASITHDQLIIFHVGFTLVPMVLFLISF